MTAIILEFPQRPELYFLFVIFGSLFGLASFLTFRRCVSSIPQQLQGDTARLYYAFLLLSVLLGAFLPGPIEYLKTGHLVFEKSLMSGLFFGWIAAESMKSLTGIKGPTGEVFSFSLPLSLCVGRFACFFGHCCYGIPSSGGVVWLVEGHPRYPIPLWESIFHGASFLLILWTRNVKELEGQRFRLYVLFYCVFRFFSEFYRGSPPLLGGLSVFQLMALILSIVILAVFLKERSSDEPIYVLSH